MYQKEKKKTVDYYPFEPKLRLDVELISFYRQCRKISLTHVMLRQIFNTLITCTCSSWKITSQVTWYSSYIVNKWLHTLIFFPPFIYLFLNQNHTSFTIFLNALVIINFLKLFFFLNFTPTTIKKKNYSL